MQTVDQIGRTVVLPVPATRIVSLVPSQTELLVGLGLEDRIVGVTKFCVHPDHLRKTKTIVGGTKQVHFHKIEALQPDFIICNKEENTEEMVAELERIAPVWVSDISTISHTVAMIQSFGQFFNCKERGDALVEQISEQLRDFKEFMSYKPVQRVAYVIWKDPWMIAGQDTFIQEMLRLNKFENITLPNSRYPEVNMVDLEAADVVLLSSEPYPFKKRHVSELRNALSADVRLVDGEYFSWYGSRLIQAFDYFKTLH
ncbi:MAG: helical backbone metal receptor [Marinirhabdus sp.]|nr:helical backbone metal receptor [Marinirhabdus sp.]